MHLRYDKRVTFIARFVVLGREHCNPLVIINNVFGTRSFAARLAASKTDNHD
jgi:hypothetical protein